MLGPAHVQEVTQQKQENTGSQWILREDASGPSSRGCIYDSQMTCVFLIPSPNLFYSFLVYPEKEEKLDPEQRHLLNFFQNGVTKYILHI